MMWRRTTGIVTADGVRAEQVSAFLTERRILGVVETSGVSFETVGLTLAADAEDHAAILTGAGMITAGAGIADIAQDLANAMNGEVSFGDQRWVGQAVDARGSDPFEQPLGADIAAYADRAVVFTRAPERGLVDIASQVDDVVYAVAHLDGHAVCITEGPILTTLDWDEDTRPALIIEYGAAAPSVTVIPVLRPEAHTFTWGNRELHTPTTETAAETAATHAFIDATLGHGALVGELMRVFPAVEPGAVRESLAQGFEEFFAALGLPAPLLSYLESRTNAQELPDAEEVHPASFARSVRRVVTEASSTVSERAEAMRARAVAVRTRAETAFDAAEAFAEDVVLPVRQNWVSPALAVAETTLGVLALRQARKVGGAGGGALGVGAVLLLGDAAVNTVISLAPLLRRKH